MSWLIRLGTPWADSPDFEITEVCHTAFESFTANEIYKLMQGYLFTEIIHSITGIKLLALTAPSQAFTHTFMLSL